MNFGAGFWRLADPKISLASFAALFLGACAAATQGPLHWGWLGVTVLGIFAVEVAKNASGEIVDFDSGTDLAVAAQDRSPFSGGKRVLVDGLLTRRQTGWIAAASYVMGLALGLWIAWAREPRILWIGLAGIACAYFYHGAPLRLAYRGWGEVAVALCYGPLICIGMFLVQRGHVPGTIIAVSLPLGLQISAFLLINEFPDYAADRAAGKNNWVVRLGRRRASRLFVAMQALALVILAALPAVTLPRTVWLGLISAVPAQAAARRLLAAPETTALIIPAQVRALQTFVVYAAGAGLGLLAAR